MTVRAINGIRGFRHWAPNLKTLVTLGTFEFVQRHENSLPKPTAAVLALAVVEPSHG